MTRFNLIQFDYVNAIATRKDMITRGGRLAMRGAVWSAYAFHLACTVGTMWSAEFKTRIVPVSSRRGASRIIKFHCTRVREGWYTCIRHEGEQTDIRLSPSKSAQAAFCEYAADCAARARRETERLI